MVELNLTIPNAWWLTSNQRLHWAAKAKRTKAIRELAATYAKVARLGTFERVHVTTYIGYPTNAKADPGNAAPTIKAALDGLTDAGVWEDDDSLHVIGPDYRRDPHKAPKGHHTVRLVLVDQHIPFGSADGDI